MVETMVNTKLINFITHYHKTNHKQRHNNTLRCLFADIKHSTVKQVCIISEKTRVIRQKTTVYWCIVEPITATYTMLLK